jgi:hypothetical protein
MSANAWSNELGIDRKLVWIVVGWEDLYIKVFKCVNRNLLFSCRQMLHLQKSYLLVSVFLLQL